MGKVPERETERDKTLISDYKTGGFTMVELVSKYRITPTRIYQILEDYGVVRKGQDYGKGKRK